MTAPWKWVSKQALVLLHGESLAEHGGGTGIRDIGMLDSALSRPLNLVAYAEPHAAPDLASLAAAYGHSLAENHPFVDGNKRAALLSVGLFLYLNGHRLSASQAEATLAILGLAAGDVGETQFAQWLRARTTPRKA